MKSKKKIIVIIGLLIIGFIALLDSLGYFSDKPYTAVPHGSHSHYVPENRDPDVPLDSFPMEKPGPDEKITPDGRVVKK